MAGSYRSFCWGQSGSNAMSDSLRIASPKLNRPVRTMESARPKTVLCVDDEKIGLRVRKIMLESRGFRVLTASDGAEGLESLR